MTETFETLDPTIQTLTELSSAMGDKITLNQGLEIADKLEQAEHKILQKGYEGDSFDLGSIMDEIIKEVLGK